MALLPRDIRISKSAFSARALSRTQLRREAMFSPKKSARESVGLTPLELERVLPMTEACEQTSLSADTLQRRYPELIVRLSPRRKGIASSCATFLRFQADMLRGILRSQGRALDHPG
jgi:hypothetical protein